MHATTPGAGAELFGFQGVQEEEFTGDSRGGRGGRGGRGSDRPARGGAARGAAREQRQPVGRGGARKGGRIV